MRIVQLTSNILPVNPRFNKAISSHAASLSNELVDRGHEVHLFASSDSETKAQLHSVSDSLKSLHIDEDIKRYYTMLNIAKGYEYARNNNADVVHSHFNLLSSFSSVASGVPSLISVHSPIRDEIRPLLSAFKDEKYISFSLAQRRQMPELNWYANIYHGVDLEKFSFNPDPEDYLLYLGRITEDKGVHFAIEAAKATGIPLRIAGMSYPTEGYWQKAIEPHINGTSIRYFGEADFDCKIDLLQKAKALLFPTHPNEPFGYVMIEAMACGTPVIGLNNGSSVSEIVKDKKTGFVVDNTEDIAEAIKQIDHIDRAEVRKRAETYFSLDKMVTGYERVYNKIRSEIKK